MSKKKIYDLTFSYRTYRVYVNFSFKRFYSKFVVLGKENIPQKGPAILGPNHLNALMDALALLASMPPQISLVFLARADVFKNKFAARCLRFLKILPAFRMRDGMENLGKNNDTFDDAQATLEKGHALGIMPEGSQGDQRKIRPIAKGIFRIAFSTQEKLGDKEKVKIVPVGLDYSDRVNFGAELVVNYGKAIDVSEYMEQYQQNQAVAINQLKARFTEEFKNASVDYATENYYDCFETTAEVTNTDAVKKLNLPNDVGSRFNARRHIAKHLVEMEKNEVEKVSKLDELCSKYRNLKEKTRLKTITLEKPKSIGKLLLWALGLLLTSPIFITGFLLNMLPFFIPLFIRKSLKIKYDGFYSSFDYFLGAVIIFPLFYIIQTVVYGIFTPLIWWTIPIFFVVQYFLGVGAFNWYRAAKKYFNNIHYHWVKATKSDLIREVQKIREEIILLGGLK